jgi:hypothetical protein
MGVDERFGPECGSNGETASIALDARQSELAFDPE